MDKIQAKEELIKRYIYLYENSEFILAPLIYEETEEERYKRNQKYLKINDKERRIYLKQYSLTLRLLEELLLGANPLEETRFYKINEERKYNKYYLKRVKLGLNTLSKQNKPTVFDTTLKLNLWTLLSAVRDYIIHQPEEEKENIDLKIEALDEYFRILRYKNNGQINNNGYHNLPWGYWYNIPYGSKDGNDNIGIKNNEFINALTGDDAIYLTEEEKQQIYLLFHDELPWNLETTCTYDNSITRPIETEPCNKTFYIKEEEIFISHETNNCLYYQLCPHCGYIVNIEENLLPEGIKKRIQERNTEDPHFSRICYLSSEIKQLEAKRKIKKQTK